jgi:hypothetical protein
MVIRFRLPELCMTPPRHGGHPRDVPHAWGMVVSAGPHVEAHRTRTGRLPHVQGGRYLPSVATDRFALIKEKLRTHKVYYSRYDPSSAFMHAVESAEDDVLWMVYEIERLRGQAPGATRGRRARRGPRRGSP